MPDRERTLRCEAVVLRHTDWGEADRVLTLFTQEEGKQRAVAKGARKLKSRKAGHLEPFTRVKLMLARGRDFWIVTQAETVDAYLPLREDLLKTAYAAYILELIDRFTYEEGSNRLLYSLLVDTLQRVSEMEAPLPALRYYEIHLLDLVGFRPELFRCVKCEETIQAVDQFFSPARGGVLCPNCGKGEGARSVPVKVLKYLRHYQRSTFREAARVPLPMGIGEQMEALLNEYITYILERRLNSPAFVHEIQHQQEKD
ncbi:MAG TPA: DNA repair protein RecO [Anaerolineaceae bacterium]